MSESPPPEPGWNTPCPPANRPATVRVNAADKLGAFVRPEQYNNRFGLADLLGPGDLAFLRGLRLRIVRVWGRPTADAEALSRYDEYLRTSADLADEMLMSVGGYEAVRDGELGMDAYAGRVEQLLLDVKTRHPKLRYVECLNEYRCADGSWDNPARFDEYFAYYRRFAEVIDELNARELPGPPLALGGPVTCDFHEADLAEFLDRVKQAGTRLDFVSYHQYQYGRGFHGRPAVLGFEKQIVRGLLARRGLDANISIFITEHGVLPEGPQREAADVEADAIVQAAAMPTAALSYMNSGPGHPIPFQWVTRHGQNERKNQLAPGRDGMPTPYGNVLKMLSMLKAERLAAACDATDSGGLGVHVLATGDAAGLAVMVWNYQWVARRDRYAVRLEVDSLDNAFRTAGFRVERFLVDAEHGNFRRTPESPQMAKVTEESMAPVGTYRTTFPLAVNAVSLLVLTPGDGA